MKHITYYTVIIGKRTCTVRYVIGPAYEVQRLDGTFADAGEASQEVKIALEGKLEFLTQGMFQRKVAQLALHYKLDLMKLQAWNLGV